MGLLEPIVVIPQQEKYRIVAGERRWRAAQIAGLEQIPIVQKPYQTSALAGAIDRIGEQQT